MAKPKLTRDQVDEIVHLREEKGWSAARIAVKFGISVSAVNFRLLREGIDPWDVDKHRRKIGRQPGAFSADEDARMLELARTMSPYQIAKAIGRPQTSVAIRLMTLEVRAEKALENAA